MSTDDWDDQPTHESSATALFEGDDGHLDLDQRRALNVLLKHRFVTPRSHPREWATITTSAHVLRRTLHDLFLDLILDRTREVAYKRQIQTPTGGAPFPTLLHDTAWGREATVVLVFLRTRYRNQAAAGETRVYVDREEIHEYVNQRRPTHATDKSGDDRKVRNAIDTVVTSGLLIGAANADRFEISHAIEVLLPIDKLRDLLAWLTAQNNPDTPAVTPAGIEDAHGLTLES